ncbi:MAG: ABC transporter permease [Chloroflexaceae bacterium]|nr:ABC transporter permease [Chloroflexaceae bacterium]
MTVRPTGGTRRLVIAGFFLFVGILIMFGYLPLVGAPEAEISRLSFGIGPQAPALDFPTVPTMLLIGALYLASGVLGFFRPLERVATPLLWLSGLLIIPAVLIAAAAGTQTNASTMIAETLRLGTPLVLGALAGIYAERSGIVNIAIEGMMLIGAAFGFAAFVFVDIVFAESIAAAFGQTVDVCRASDVRPLFCFLPIGIGVLAAMLLGGLAALLHGLLSINFRTDQIISGTVINILAIGMTGYLRRVYLVDAQGGRVTLPEIPIPVLSEIPIMGDILFSGKPIFYAMFILVIVTNIVIFSTRWGLRMRAVGENPRAADTLGINVYRTRYLNLFISGLIAGLGGAWFSLETVGNFDDGMTAGKGFIALAAMIFGKWTPFGAFGGAMLFGFAEALATRFQLLQVQMFGWLLPVQFLQILPYVTTIIVLAGLIGRATPPAAIGQPYEK